MLTIEHLCVDYKTRGAWTPGLQDFSLTIQSGEAVGLVGPSGSGKSTVALAILRLIRAGEGRITSGRILFNDQDLLALPEESMRQIRGRDIAMIFQDPFTSLNPVMRIGAQMQEMLDAHVRADPGGRQARHATLFASLNEVQLDSSRILSSYPHQLSGGQRQRVMIAMALLCKPQLILADEPTTALDVLVQKEILDLMSRMQKEYRVAMLFITHNVALLSKYASRVVTIEKKECDEPSAD